MDYLNILARQIDHHCQAKGFNDDFVVYQALLLVHSEVTEAVEELRAGHTIDEIYYSHDNFKPEGFPVEIADAIIRHLHICARCHIDIDEVINMKMTYNAGRNKMHGKSF